MMFFSDHLEAASELLDYFRAHNLKLATAESCTGGLITALLTEIPGSSDVVEGGFVTYSNDLKASILDVSWHLLDTHGAVSDEVACAMAQGAIAKTGADYAVGVTGVAGPSGGSSEKPVGLVYIAIAGRSSVICKKNMFVGNRTQIRAAAISKAIEMLKESV